MSTYIGLDIGGTKIIVAAADANGRILRQVRAATSDSLETGLNTLHALITQTADGEPISGMGAAIGGPLDWKRGIVSPLHQPSWRNVPLKEIMQARWGCPFWVDVDTNIAALGEFYFGNVSGALTCFRTHMAVNTGTPHGTEEFADVGDAMGRPTLTRIGMFRPCS